MGAKRRVFLSIGSNIGDRWSFIRKAVSSIPDVAGVSSVYETEPVEVSGHQEPYLNAVVELFTDRLPAELLEIVRRAEDDAGRIREIYHGSRTLDVDILLIGDETVDTPELQVPHPRMWQRRFVVEPLAELAPDLVPANWRDVVTGEVWVAGTL